MSLASTTNRRLLHNFCIEFYSTSFRTYISPNWALFAPDTPIDTVRPKNDPYHALVESDLDDHTQGFDNRLSLLNGIQGRLRTYLRQIIALTCANNKE